MTGWLVVNHFVKLSNFDEIFEWLEKAAAKNGIELLRKTNAELLGVLAPLTEKPDFVLFWDKDIRLARFLEEQGIRLFNTSEAIALCDDKGLTHVKLLNSGIKMPATIIAPKTYDGLGYGDYSFDITAQLGFPMVVKECFGSFGWQVYLANDRNELESIVKKIGIKPMLFQEFVKSSSGTDIRISIVGGKVIAAIRRFSTNGDFRANVSAGAQTERYETSEAQKAMALLAAKELGLDFCGVDILFGEGGEPVLCEVNSNAQFQGLYRATGVNMAEHIIEHIGSVCG